MNNFQNTHQDANKRVQKFNTDHAADTATIPDYASEQSLFDTAVAKIDQAAQNQAADNSGIGEDKKNRKNKMAFVVILFAMRGVVKARQLGNTDVAAALDHPETFISQASDSDAVTRAKDMVKVMNDNLATLTNIVAADITAMNTAITAFDSIKGDPTIAVEQKKATGTDPINGLIVITDLHIDGMKKLIHSYFSISKPILVDEFDLISQLIPRGVRHNKAEIDVVDSMTNTAIEGATITCISNHKTATTDDTGIGVIDGVKTGNQKFEIIAPGYTTQIITLHIHRSVLNKIIVHLVKV